MFRQEMYYISETAPEPTSYTGNLLDSLTASVIRCESRHPEETHEKYCRCASCLEAARG